MNFGILFHRFRFRNWPIRYKVLSSLFFVSLIPLLLFVMVSGFNRYRTELENVEIWLARDAENSGYTIETNLANALNTVYNNSQETRLLGQVTFHARALHENPDYDGITSLTERTQSTLQEQLVRNAIYQSIRLVTADGQLLALAGNVPQYASITRTNQTEHPAYRALPMLDLAAATPALIPPYPDPETRELVLEVATMIVADDALLGYLIFTLDPGPILFDPLVIEMGDQRPSSLQGEYIFLVDNYQRLLSPTQNHQPFTLQVNLYDETENDEAPTGPLSSVQYRNWADDLEEVTTAPYTIDQYGWTVVAETRDNDVIEPIITGLVNSTIAILIFAVLLAVILLVMMGRQLVRPISELTETAQQIAAGELDTIIPHPDRGDEVGRLSTAVATMTENLRFAIGDLEQRVSERTRDLELTTVIAREASQLEDVPTLLDHTVNLIVESYPLVYHAQVFLIDETQEYARLVASTGRPGRELLARNHQLAVGSVSVIGRVTEYGSLVVARDTSDSRVHRRNEFLPDTRAEMALPLMRGDHILGALDIQSRSPDAFTEEEQTVFATLADQLAVTIDNARHLDNLNKRLVATESYNRRLTRTNWQELLTAARRPGYLAAAAGLAEADEQAGWSQWQQQAAQQRDVVLSEQQDDGMRYLAVPIIARDEVLGVIEWQIVAEQVNSNTVPVARQLSNLVATNLETVRLLERSERLAERERLVNELSGKLTSEPSVGLILQTAVQELSSILQTPQVNIQLKRPSVPENSPVPENKPVPVTGPTENA